MKRLFKRKKANSDAGSLASGRSASGYEVASKKDLPKLHNAAREGNLTKLKNLLKKSDVNQLDKENRTALHIACAYEKKDVVLMLVKHPHCNMNLCDSEKRSALMKCVQCQSYTCLDVLVDKGADVTLYDTKGNTALHLAASIPSKEFCLSLIDASADIHCKNKDGSTPLHLAATVPESEDVIKLLLEDGAQINANDAFGKTPLMLAASHGHLEVVKLLLSKGADTSVHDTKGWAADDYASMSGNHPIAHVIVEHSVKQKKSTPSASRSPSIKPQSPPQLENNTDDGSSDLSDISQDDLSRLSDNNNMSGARHAYVPAALQPPKPKVNVAEFLKQRQQLKNQVKVTDSANKPESSSTFISPKSFLNGKKEKGEELDEVTDKSDSESSSLEDATEPDLRPQGYASNSRKGSHVSPAKPPLPSNRSAGSLTSSPIVSAQKAVIATKLDDNDEDSPWDSGEEDDDSGDRQAPMTSRVNSPEKTFAIPTKNMMAELGLDDEDVRNIYDNPSEESIEFSSPTLPSNEEPHPEGEMQPSLPISTFQPSKQDNVEDDEISKVSSSWDEDSESFPPNTDTKPAGVDILAGASLLKFDDDLSEEADPITPPPHLQLNHPTSAVKGSQELVDSDKDVEDKDESSSSWDSDKVTENPPALRSVTSTFKANAAAVTTLKLNDEVVGDKKDEESEDEITESESSWETEKRKSQQQHQPKTVSNEVKRNEATLLEDSMSEEDSFDDSDKVNRKPPTSFQKTLLGTLAAEAAKKVQKKKEMQEREGRKSKDAETEAHVSTQDREMLETALREALDEPENLSESDSSDLDDSYMGNVAVGKKMSPGQGRLSSIPVPVGSHIHAPRRKQVTTYKSLDAHHHINGFDTSNWTGTETETDADEEPLEDIPTSLIASPLSEQILRSGERGALEREASREKQRAMDTLEKLDYAQRVIEQHEEKIREYKRLEDEWRKTNSEMEASIRKLNFEQTRLKEQLSSSELELKMSQSRVIRLDEQLQLEGGSRRKQEVTIRELSTELKNTEQSLRKLEVERSQLQQELLAEQQKIALHEHVSKEKEKVDQGLKDEHSHESRHIEALNLLMREKDQELMRAKADRDALEDTCKRYKKEISQFYANGDDQRSLMGKLNEELNDRVHELTRDLSASEEVLNQAALQHNLQLSHLKQANETLTNQIKKERGEKENILRDLEVLNDQQRALKRTIEDQESKERRDENRMKDLERDLRELKERKEEIEKKLHSSEVADNLTQHEANNLRTSLAHKESLLAQVTREKEEMRENMRRRELDLNEAQRENAKLSGRVEMLQADVAQQESERLRLRRELEEARNFGNTTLTNQQGKFSDLVTDHQKERLELEKTNAQLNQQVAHLREEVKRINEEKMNKDEELALAQQDRIETHKHLSFTESSMAQLTESQRQLQEDKRRISTELDASRGRCNSLENRVDEANRQISSLRSELESEKSACNSARRDLQSLELDSSQNRDSLSRLENRLKEFELTNAKLQSELSTSMTREQHVKDEQNLMARSRSQLEELITRIQEDKASADQKMRDASNRCKLLQAEADGHKQMWESEVKARSKLSVEYAKADKERKDAMKLMEKYKRKLTRATEQGRLYQTKFETQQKRRSQLEDRLEYHSKRALENRIRSETSESECESRLSSMSEEFRHERTRLDDTINQLQAQVSTLGRRLSEESEAKIAASQELEKLKNFKAPQNDTSASELERERDELREELRRSRQRDNKQTEAARANSLASAEVNAKLDQVNSWLEERAAAQEVLERLRFENEEKRVAEANRRAESLQRELDVLRQRMTVQQPSVDHKEKEFQQSVRDNIELHTQLQRTRVELEEQKVKLARERKKYQNLHTSAISGSIAGHIGSGLNNMTSYPFNTTPFFPTTSPVKVPGETVMSSTPRKDLSEPVLTQLRNKLDVSIAQKLADTRNSASPGSEASGSSQRKPEEGSSRPTSNDYFRIP
ncbi:uncharacterized protein LOC143459131 isoform X1 [Clavelina lepadiformis]|uniref:uncharacterized protein LOC143459131 isoform X1 n=1 Tax=Clavelina lepadiformis TaxID=159417 RepID=UPI00404358CB